MKTHRILAALLLMTSLAACGSETKSAASGAAQIAVPLKGFVRAFAFPATETLPSFSSFEMRLFDAGAIWTDATGGQASAAATLYDAGLPGMSDNCAQSGCSYPIAPQNIANAGPNIVALVNGSTSASQRYWAPTYTNIVDSNTLLNVQQHRGTLNATAPAYVISQYGLGQLANQLGLQDAATLLERGLVIGLVRGKDPANYSGGLPAGVSGAQINLTPEQSAIASLYYPNAGYTTAINGTATNADGAFYLVGKIAGATLAPTTLSITATASSDKWTNRPIAMIKGSVVVAPLQALP